MYFTDAIKEHALADAPNESCGLIFQESEQYVYRRYPNVWQTPENAPQDDKTRFFRIDTLSVQKALKTKALIGVAHSHTDRDEQPTDTDKYASDAIALPYYIYSTVTDRFSVYQPNHKPLPLLKRPYVPLVHDCFSLPREYFCLHHADVEIPFFEHTVEDGLKGKTSGVVEYFEANGWRPVSRVRPFDVVIMNVKCHNFPNHIGIIMENGVHMLHHLYQRFSEIHVYDGYWKKATMLTMRHPKFFDKNV